MKDEQRWEKILSLLLVCGLLTIVSAGCSNKANATTSSTKSTISQGQTKKNIAQRQAQIKTQLDQLVKNQTINAKQETAVLNAFNSNWGKGKPAQGNSSAPNSNSAQSNGSGQGQKLTRINPLQTLINNGTINQTQADAIMKAIRSQGGFSSHNRRPQSTGNTSTGN